MTDHTDEVETDPRYENRPTHCPCGERTCPDTLNDQQAHYTSTTTMDGKRIHDRRLHDPLITSVTVVSWLDLLQALFKGSLTIRVEVSACREMTGAVVRLGRLTDTQVVDTFGTLDNPRGGL